MKKVYLISILALATLALSCRQNTNQSPSTNSVNLSAWVAESGAVSGNLTDANGKSMVIQCAQTRISATNNVFESGDKIGVYIVEWQGATEAALTAGRLEPSGNQTDNHPFTYVAGPPKSWSADILKNPLTWRKINAFSYHPYQDKANNANNILFTVRADQSTYTIRSTDYLMWGVGDNNASGYPPLSPLKLIFKHKLARLTLKITLPAQYNGAMIASIDGAAILSTPQSADLSLSDGKITPSTTKGDVKMHVTEGASKLEATFNAVVVPNLFTKGQGVIRIDYTDDTKAKGSLYYYADKTGFELKENTIYTLTLATAEFNFAGDLAEFTAAGSTTSFTVRSGVATRKWKVEAGDSWFTISADNGVTWVKTLDNQTGTAELKIKVSQNSTGQSRINRLLLTDKAANAEPLELVVFQNK